jgi:hypothetical protein
MRRPLLAVTLLLTAAACAHRAPPPPTGSTITLRVAHVVNPGLPRMSAAQLDAALAAARLGARENFGVDVRFTGPEEQSLKTLFDRVTPAEARDWSGLSYDFKGGTGDRKRLTKGYAAAFRSDDSSLDSQIAFAGPHLLAPIRERTYDGFADAVTATLLARLEDLRSQKLPDGGTLIDASPVNEVLYWVFIGKLSFPYDVVITNQLIASAEYIGSAVHTAIRGGVTAGITTENPSAPSGMTVIVSTYPVIGEDGATRGLRGGESYSDGEGARIAGTLLVHEIGHDLFDFGHPYGRKACVMNPPEMLRFREWAEGLSPRDCPLR